jgi:hypothetical protein
MAIVNLPGTRTTGVAVLALAMLWLGLLAGVSFLATPAKFLAPSLSLPVALDVGRHTFAIFNRVEWFLAALLLVLLFVRPAGRVALAGAVVAAIAVAVEAAWLLPALDQRVGMIIAGEPPAASSLHNIYIVVEGVKLLALLVVGFVTGRRLACG